MANKVIRRVELVRGGTTIKQGDIFVLGYRLFDAEGAIVTPTVGQVIGVKIANKSGVIYEAVAVVVEDHIEFTVSENIGYGEMHVEIKVTEGTTVIEKYPADSVIKLKITESLDDLGVGGINAVTAESMFNQIGTIESIAAAALTKAEGAETLSLQTQTELDQAILSASGALAGQLSVGGDGTVYASAQERLILENDKTIASLAEKAELSDVANIATGTPLFASNVAGMTDTTRIYVNTTDGIVYVYNGTSFASTGRVYQSTGISDKTVTPEKTTFIKVGKNKINPKEIMLNYVLSGVTGEPVANTSYFLTGFIPMIAGESIALSNPRNIAFYSIAKVFHAASYVSNSSSGNIVVTAPFDGYVRAPFLNQYLPTAQVEKGLAVTSYESYSVTLDGVTTTSDSKVVEIETRLNDLTDASSAQSIQLTKVADLFTLKSSFATGKTISIETTKTGSRNGSFNLIRTKINTEIVHANDDDITPIRTYYTVGANHGFPVVEVTAAGKANVDLGSKWTDGTRTFTLLRVTGSILQFGFPYTVSGNTISISNVLPTTDLTHVSGATNTATVAVGYTLEQLHPSIKNVVAGYFLNGQDITVDGDHFGEQLQVRESYDVLDYKSIIDYTQANIGKDYRSYLSQIQPLVRFGITYEFTKGLNCVVYHNLRAYKALSLINTWFVQTAPLIFTNHKLMQYIPSVKIKNGYDFKNNVDMATLAENLLYAHTDSIDPNIPPDRVVQWLIDKTTGARKAGFTMGYINDKSDSKHATRVANSTSTWDVRTSLKNYPVVIGDKALNTGDFYSFIGYRNYLSPETDVGLTNQTSVNVGKETYIYIDTHANHSFKNIKFPEHVGKNIQVVEKNVDFTLHSDIVDADGLLFSVVNGYGYVILKVS